MKHRHGITGLFGIRHQSVQETLDPRIGCKILLNILFKPLAPVLFFMACSATYSIVSSRIFKFIPASVEIEKSHGYESPMFKMVMRFFALISDVVTFHLGVNLFCWYIFIYLKRSKNRKPSYLLYYIVLLLVLINPLMIIIDHGHFQYNNVMHGFFVLALFFLYTENYILAIIFYSFCINFKQMGLYYAIPFPLYVLKKLFFNNSKRSTIFICNPLYNIFPLLTPFFFFFPYSTKLCIKLPTK